MLDSIKPRHQINLPEQSTQKPRAHRRFSLRAILAVLMLVLLSVGIFAGSKLVIFAQKILEGEGREFSFRRLFLAGDKTLLGEKAGEVRILLLGIGGLGHDGGTLTDTMILATLRLSKFKDERSEVGLVSIPRDLVVNIPGHDFRKINSAYAFGESNGNRQGITLAVKTVAQVLDIDIPYYAIIDFQGFERIVNDLNGIEINVEKPFTDALFPDKQYGYLPPITFELGLQKMDGSRALQYVRSRHGDNNQGTDFARSKRQQQLLKAVKDKVSRINILTNPNLVNRILQNLANHLRTNLAPHELKRLYELGRNLENADIEALAIDVESGLLCNQIVEETGAYILVPCQGLGNYEALRNLVKNLFLIANLDKEQAVIEIQSAASSAIPALRTKELLNLPHLAVRLGSFKTNTPYEESIIYDNTGGGKPRTLKYLQEKLGMKTASSPYPFPTTAQKPDFVIVVTQ